MNDDDDDGGEGDLKKKPISKNRYPFKNLSARAMFRYRRRNSAVADSDAHEGQPVWAKDIPPGNGEQCFYTITHESFRQCVKNLRNRERHFYEMLRPDAPTHLYLDIEYEKAPNPTLGDVTIAVDRTVRRGFEVLYDIKRVECIELDASDARKYSRHLIYRVRDGRMFQNPYHCGAFLRRLHFPEAAVSSGGTTEVVDRAVYTKWRAFRCAGSSKLRAPERPLMPYRPRSIAFLDTLVQRGNPSDLLTCLERDGSDPQSGMGPRGEKRRRDEDEADLPEASFSLPESFCRSLAREIEAFWHDGTVSFMRYDRAEQMVFFTSDSRWCGQKGEEHSKNHVYFLADLRRGAWRQGCHNRTRETCYALDGATGKHYPQWGDWKPFAHAAEVREFVSRSSALQDEFLGLLAHIEHRLGGE